MSARRAAMRGQTMIIFALAMSLFLFGLMCLVVDLSYLYAYSARAQASSQIAAQAGANTIDAQSLYNGNGTIVVDPARAKAVCELAARRYLGPSPALAGVGSNCTVAGNNVSAVVTLTVRLPLALFGNSQTVGGRFQAAPVVGTACPVVPGQTAPPLCPPPVPPVAGP